jgi:AcrR family transcriptional regulator
MENIFNKIFSTKEMRKEIIVKSLAEFKKNGIRKMTVQQLAAQLGISTKTLYKHFHDKEKLLEACMTLYYSQLHGEILEVLALPYSPAVRLIRLWIGATKLDFGTTHVFFGELNYYYPALQDKIIRKYEKKFGAPILMLIDEGIDKGFFRKELNASLILQGCASIYSLLTRTSDFKKFRVDGFLLAENIMGSYFRGLCTKKGLQEIDKNQELTSFTRNI